jgi:hypothetical protein
MAVLYELLAGGQGGGLDGGGGGQDVALTEATEPQPA